MAELLKEQRELLRHIYYDEKFMFGRDKLFAYISANFPLYEITRRQIQLWLNEQEIHQLYYKPKKRQTTNIVKYTKANQAIAIDLIDLTAREINGFCWIFTAIDLYSRKAYAEAMKNKEAKTVLNTFKKLHNKIDNFAVLRSDNDTNFTSNIFKQYIKENGIHHIFSKPYTPQSNGCIERFNGTLKRMIFKVIKLGNNEWNKYLQILVENYNKSQHRITKNIPATNESKANIGGVEKEKTKNKILKIGQQVRKLENQDNPDHYKGKETYSKKIYIITSVFKSRKYNTATQYTINDETGKKYFLSDLLAINTVHHKIQEEYKVSKLIRPLVTNGKRFYVVKWAGYKNTTIEPRRVLIKDIPKIVKRFEERNAVKWQKNSVKFSK
jgi:transposase InsO family protein